MYTHYSAINAQIPSVIKHQNSNFSKVQNIKLNVNKNDFNKKKIIDEK